MYSPRRESIVDNHMAYLRMLPKSDSIPLPGQKDKVQQSGNMAKKMEQSKWKGRVEWETRNTGSSEWSCDMSTFVYAEPEKMEQPHPQLAPPPPPPSSRGLLRLASVEMEQMN